MKNSGKSFYNEGNCKLLFFGKTKQYPAWLFLKLPCQISIRMKKILVLTTDKSLQQELKEKLAYFGFKAQTLSDFDNLFSVIQSFRPDLLLIDFILHDSNGGAICHQVKCDPQTHALPVIILSEYPEFGAFSKKFGCSESVTKPVDFSELVRKINIYTQDRTLDNLFKTTESELNRKQKGKILQH